MIDPAWKTLARETTWLDIAIEARKGLRSEINKSPGGSDE